jgi:hypothetical protein
MSNTPMPHHTYEWDCPLCHGNNVIASEAPRSDVKCGWCGHQIDAQQCRVVETDC